MINFRSRSINSTLRLLIGAALLIAIYRNLDFSELFQHINQIPHKTFLLTASLLFLSQAFSAAKWKMILEDLGVKSNYKSVFKSYFLGMLINCFGFGTLGGDAARTLTLKDNTSGQKRIVLASVILDRIHGLSLIHI